ncbi:hypothetical protein X275_07655 [Marinitoga sp. 1197]|nr:hypothetical protein X275_07655 [Marinitoga sp. 1197]
MYIEKFRQIIIYTKKRRNYYSPLFVSLVNLNIKYTIVKKKSLFSF